MRLIREIYEDLLRRSNENKEAINEIKDTIDNEISTVRNITYQMLDKNGGKNDSKILTIYSNKDKKHFIDFPVNSIIILLNSKCIQFLFRCIVRFEWPVRIRRSRGA